MNPLIKYGIAVALALGALFGSYMLGTAHTAARWKVIVADMNAEIATQRTAHAHQRAEFEQRERDKEQAHATHIAAIDAKHQKEIHERETSTQRTIAGLRDGSLRLRDKFTSCQRATDSPAGEAGTATGSSDGAASIGLQVEDAQVLILWADDADRVADQLRACQAIVTSDRATQPEPKDK